MKKHSQVLAALAALGSVAATASMAFAADDSKAYEIDWWNVIKSSPTLWVLLTCSFIMVGFWIERIWTYRSFAGDAEGLMKGVAESLDGGNVSGAIEATKQQDIPLARVLRYALVAWPVSKAGVQEKIEIARIREKAYMEKRLGFFATMSTTGPFIGLFGTVLGIVAAFHTLAVTGAGGKEQLMKGISEALVATAAGIFVGVLSAVFFNQFTLKMKHILAEIDVYAKELTILLFEHNKSAVAGASAKEPAGAARK